MLQVHTRGYRYELTPPVPIEVLPGTVRGSVRMALRGLWPLPRQLPGQAVQAAEGGTLAAPSSP